MPQSLLLSAVSEDGISAGYNGARTLRQASCTLASLRDSAICNLCSQARDFIWRWPLPIEIMTELETALAIEDRCTPNFVL